jgi:serine protease inhibitor
MFINLFLRSNLGETLESGSGKLKVSGVMQKAVIEVNEKSTEAAATSAITITNR